MASPNDRAASAYVLSEPENITDVPPLIHLVDDLDATACGSSTNRGHAKCPASDTLWSGERFCGSCGRAICGACLIIAAKESSRDR